MQPAFLSRNCLHPKGSAPLLPPSPVMGVTAVFKGLALRYKLEISLKDHSSSRISCRTGWPCCSITMQFILFFYLILFPWLFSRWRFREHFPHTDFKVSHQLPGPAWERRKSPLLCSMIHEMQRLRGSIGKHGREASQSSMVYISSFQCQGNFCCADLLSQTGQVGLLLAFP